MSLKGRHRSASATKKRGGRKRIPEQLQLLDKDKLRALLPLEPDALPIAKLKRILYSKLPGQPEGTD